MVGVYEIYSGDGAIGTAKVTREGLYYQFDCQCRLECNEICKIYVRCGENQTLLGTPVPENGAFVLRTRLPKKRFCGDKMEFTIDGDKAFLPVSPDEPFLHLADLKDAIFAVCNGQCGVIIKKKPDA